MDARKLFAVALASLLVSAGVGAAATSTGAGATVADSHASIDGYDAVAAYDDGTVTFSVTDNGSAVSGAPVAVDGDSVGVTDVDGSVTFDVNASEEFTVVVSNDEVTGEFTYAVDNGSLSLVEGGFEAVDDGTENETETNETDLNETDLNETDLNETDLNETELNETNETTLGMAGPQLDLPANASDNARSVLSAINTFLSGESDAETLGEAVSAVAGNAPEDAGKPDDVGPKDDKETGPPEDAGPKGDKQTGKPDDVGPKHDDDDEDDDSSGNNGNGNGNNGNGNGGR
ncbi:hypothetical protein [Halobaculum marinum]|uniref:Uncharacterized protein n=1 Tax=Halobaculum marinum TaxID=3031996 RepID=A0ABD5WVH1_9EURY|nr:hypothetical protein [Halobaculum sp. DT55]